MAIFSRRVNDCNVDSSISSSSNIYSLPTQRNLNYGKLATIVSLALLGLTASYMIFSEIMNDPLLTIPDDEHYYNRMLLLSMRDDLENMDVDAASASSETILLGDDEKIISRSLSVAQFYGVPAQTANTAPHTAGGSATQTPQTQGQYPSAAQPYYYYYYYYVPNSQIAQQSPQPQASTAGVATIPQPQPHASVPAPVVQKAQILPPNPLTQLSSPAILPIEISSNVADMNTPLQPRQLETPLFWHVPKAGGTAVQHLYWCMGLTLANEVGGNPKFKKDASKYVEVFQPWDHLPNKVVNVDTTTYKGLLRAKSMNLLGTHDKYIDYTKRENYEKDMVPKMDLILTGEFQLTAEMLYSEKHKARVFGFFRHPVHRAASMFYYLQKATWEPTYNPAYQTMSLADYARQTGGENNYMVRKLVGKNYFASIEESDLEIAKKIVKEKMIVGIMDEFEESIHRFNAIMGVDENKPENLECFDKYAAKEQKTTLAERQDANREFAKDQRQNTAKQLRKATDARNSNEHPDIEETSPAWEAIAKKNQFDMKLYQFVRAVFDEQKALFDVGGIFHKT
mmetsp:Transcript_23955/g.49614  ORF Transcript_23955/g.49614 Transcript_23955/m.49614 type:complete len:568 (+) Transcript_23955:305-2008(+)|eukprot:CAMPEP_0171344394 /NCGR_PEP_ID=MMETSP0878-20121228/19266_1 /TAXON_ID=67004 /ORGANISM="Thalassiosira weissflogii, Strain CCMP1336" /LENGTH=567 /DNA_ID=CAMNT_0011847567 /DNA_START=227 /DNA_END=1930 /DNA_ORIENTATION=-